MAASLSSVGDEESYNKSRPPGSLCSPAVTLQFVDICYRVKVNNSSSSGGTVLRLCGHDGSLSSSETVTKEKTILSGVTGMASPGEMLAVLGPSGSGKSTLLSIISGRLQGGQGGAVLFGGRLLTRSAAARRVGFVPQDDLLYPNLTVRETLVFSALLRLPKTISRAEKLAAAETIIIELGLESCADTIIGGAFVRGVSGGERKRVSIGQEVLVGPNVLVLDEPTSGLDATSAYRVVTAMKTAAAKRGRAVVAAVHQPSSRVYQMFDSVLLLAEGRCAYFGRGNEAMDYFNVAGFRPSFYVNPADFMLDLANGIAPESNEGEIAKTNVKESVISSYNKLLAPKTKTEITASIASNRFLNHFKQSEKHSQKDFTRISWFSQFTTLLRRSLKERRHESFNSLRIFQVTAAAILAGSMWWRSNAQHIQDRLGLLFFISIFWGVFASSNAVFSFPRDRPIFLSESTAGFYSCSSYFTAKIVGDLPMELSLPTLFITVLYFMAGLRPDLTSFMLTLAVLLCYVLVAQGLGLAVGAAMADAKQASMVVTVTMLAFLLTGGFYVQHVPACIDWVKYASFTYYAYRLFIDVQYRGMEMQGSPLMNFSWHGQGAESESKEVGAAVSVTALALMFVGYRLLAYAALRRTK